MPLVKPKIEILVEAVAETKKAQKELKALDNTVKSVEKSARSDAFSGGFFGGLTGTTAIYAVEKAIGYVADSFEEVIKLSKDKPELFTAEQLRNVKDYNSALGDLKDSFTQLKIEIVAGVAPALTEMLRGLNNSADIRARANELVAMGASREQALAQAAREVNDATREQAQVTKDAEVSMKDYEKTINDVIATQNKYYSSQISNVEKLAGMREKNIQTEEQFADRRTKINNELVQASS